MTTPHTHTLQMSKVLHGNNWKGEKNELLVCVTHQGRWCIRTKKAVTTRHRFAHGGVHPGTPWGFFQALLLWVIDEELHWCNLGMDWVPGWMRGFTDCSLTGMSLWTGAHSYSPFSEKQTKISAYPMVCHPQCSVSTFSLLTNCPATQKTQSSKRSLFSKPRKVWDLSFHWPSASQVVAATSQDMRMGSWEGE